MLAAILLSLSSIPAVGATTFKDWNSETYLPFGPSDDYDTKLWWKFRYEDTIPDAKIGQYEVTGETYLVKKDQCIFYSKFGLRSSSTSFHGTCGDTCRWSDPNWLSVSPDLSAATKAAKVTVIDKHLIGTAGMIFHNDLDRIDQTCLP